jgi:hypothetical protein
MSHVATEDTAPARRRYHRWAQNETLEDYSLRFAPTTFRRWSPFVVASTALGGIAYLADYAIGASVVLANGTPSAVLGILLAGRTCGRSTRSGSSR